MEPPESTSPAAVVEDEPAAAFLLDADRVRFLHPFMRGEHSTAEAASAVGVSVKDMAYRVKRMRELGLLTLTRERKRAGRPVRYYRAPDAFFVPFAMLPQADLEESVASLLRSPQQRLIAGLVRALTDRELQLHRWGWRLELDAEERVSIRPSDEAAGDEPLFRRLLRDDAPAVYMANLPLWLDHGDAKRLQRELVELVRRYDGRNGNTSYMFTVGLTPSREPSRGQPR